MGFYCLCNILFNHFFDPFQVILAKTRPQEVARLPVPPRPAQIWMDPVDPADLE